tara:strand:+ start:9117 stop:10325 length:1209 start_codon:yes stop_codon:yes gene_type:complete
LEKKNIILIIRRGPLEIEWILPVLNELYQKKFDIFVYFNNYKCFNLVKESKSVFKNLNKISKIFYVQKKTDFLFEKILRKISVILSLKKIEIFFSDKIHSFENLLKKLRIQNINNVSYVLSEYGNLTYTLELLSKTSPKNRPKIVQYPAAPTVNLDNDKRIKETQAGKIARLKIFADLILINSSKALAYWKLYNLNKYAQIKVVGVPNFDKKILKKKKNKKNKKKILLALNDIELHKLLPGELDLFKRCLNLFFEEIKKFRNVYVVLKQHPNKPLDIEKYLNKKFIYQISKKDMLDEINDTNILVTQFKTSATVYGPLYKLPTISWPNIFKGAYKENKDPYAELGVTYETKNIKDLIKKLNLAIKHPNNVIWKLQQKNFLKRFNSNGSPIKKVILELEKLSN